MQACLQSRTSGLAEGESIPLEITTKMPESCTRVFSYPVKGIFSLTDVLKLLDKQNGVNIIIIGNLIYGC
jgi:hypothetical protein